ncbi:hypothetical protein EP342_01400, partial [bacterium]
MKQLIIFFILSFSIIYAQDNEPTPWGFKWGFSTTQRPFEPDSFQQESFFTGFQWSGSTKMNNALGNNTTTTGNYYTPDETVLKKIHLQLQPSWIDGTGYVPGYYGAVMMQYDPSLPLTTSNFGNILRPDDPANPIFGFLQRRGRVPTISTDPDYSRIILEKDSTYVDGKVLSNVYPVPNFESNTGYYSGKLWYLTINLKRLHPTTETTKDNTVILSLKIPYTRWNNTTGFIKFNKLPVNSSTANYDMDFFESRGKAQDMATVTTPLDSISITRNMLPISSDGYESITISGEFATDNSFNFNPEFSTDMSEVLKIKSYDIEVKYFGHTDVAIDWVRIENSRGHHLMQGKFDSLGLNPDTNLPYKDRRGFTLIAENPSDFGDSIGVNNIKEIIQSALDTIKVESSNWRDANLYRFYFQDIESPSFFWWGAIRYCNKFSNGMYIVSDGPSYPQLYEYYTGCSNRYFGLKFHSDEHFTAEPYFRSVGGNWKTMYFKYGFEGEHKEDSLTSGYETFFANESRNGDPYIYDHIKNSTMEDYFFHLGKSDAFQSNWELSMYDKFFNPLNYKYIYSDKGWYTNLFVGFNVGFEIVGPGLVSNPENKAAVGSNVRPKTGEEIRTLFMTNLIMGAKGIYFDREESDSIFHYDTLITYSPLDTTIIPRYHTFFGLGDGTKNAYYNPDDLDSFINSDTLGSDYPNGIGDIYNIADFINKDSVSKYAKISPDRVYIGTKSTRIEVKNMIDWIRLNDIELMDMRLQATYSKGFKTFENWNPYKFQFWGNSPLRKIVNLDSIKTRKLFEPKHTLAHNTNPGYEDRDSSFFDITLLQHKNSKASDIYKNKNALYLGIQNRRTDPLIFRDSLDNQDTLRELMFFSSAEFDDRVRYGGTDLWGVNQDSTWWQSQWWKRLGAREINIPLDIKPYGNGTYIVASEIGIDSLNNLGWRYDDKYYHRVDTLLNYDDSLKTKLLPGQGKIIKLDFVPYFFNDPTKDTIPGNDSCYFCDVFNNFDVFDFKLVESGSGELGCCYNLSLIYKGNCTFDNIPIRILFDGTNDNNFISGVPGKPLVDSIGTHIRYLNMTMSFDSTSDTLDLGSFCTYGDSANTYTISLLAGKDKDGKFIGCDRELSYKVECKGDTAVKSCCDGLNVAVTYSTQGQLECTTWKIDSNYNTECIYGVSIESSEFYRIVEPVGSTPIAKGGEYTACYSPFPGCIGDS